MITDKQIDLKFNTLNDYSAGTKIPKKLYLKFREQMAELAYNESAIHKFEELIQ